MLPKPERPPFQARLTTGVAVALWDEVVLEVVLVDVVLLFVVDLVVDVVVEACFVVVDVFLVDEVFADVLALEVVFLVDVVGLLDVFEDDAGLDGTLVVVVDFPREEVFVVVGRVWLVVEGFASEDECVVEFRADVAFLLSMC